MAESGGEGTGIPQEVTSKTVEPKTKQESKTSEGVVAHLKDRKTQIYSSTQSITGGLLDIYKGVFVESDQPVDKQTDLDELEAEIERIPKEKTHI